MRCQLGDGQSVFSAASGELVTIVLTFRSQIEVDAARVVRRDLNALVSQRRNPFANAVERIEWRFVAHELSEENGRAA